MTILNAHFDGHVLIPDEPVELKAGQRFRVHLEPVEDVPGDGHPLLKLAEELDKLPFDESSPGDRAAQHDHYLYGTPKRP